MPAPVEKASTVNQSGKVQYHDKPVSWTVDLDVPRDAKPGKYPIAGIIGYQTCEETTCDTPRAAWFSGVLTVGDREALGVAPLLLRDGKYSEAAKLAKGEALPAASSTSGPAENSNGSSGGQLLPQFKIREFNRATPINRSLWVVLAAAFGGGFILNLMPCVLPVIGLKILSFVEQSGDSRGAGVGAERVVFAGADVGVHGAGRAGLGASLGLRGENLGWGEQFSSTAFNIVMCGLVFVMALSFLGVWEIPIPGFVGPGKAAELATQEGAAGAFSKGVLSTVLATPCSGPFLGSVFGFMLAASRPR